MAASKAQLEARGRKGVGTGHSYPEGTKQAVREAFLRGVRPRKIARELGLNRNTILEWCRAWKSDPDVIEAQKQIAQDLVDEAKRAAVTGIRVARKIAVSKRAEDRDRVAACRVLTLAPETIAKALGHSDGMGPDGANAKRPAEIRIVRVATPTPTAPQPTPPETTEKP